MAIGRITREQYDRARRVIPGGVNSSVRLNSALGVPFFASRTLGSRIWDLEGREFIDMCCAHGAALLGHGHPAIDSAVQKASQLGYASMFETEFHEQLASKVCERIPCAEQVRFCNSGTEATLHLIRACRAYTGRSKILRCEGHFHGYHELIYIGGHPPPEHLAENRHRPYIESAGIPREFADLIIPVPFNDSQTLRQAIDQHGSEIALAIVEPVNFNSGCILPDVTYLQALRELTKDKGIVLCFDEIQSCFKTASGSAQAHFGVIPDVCTLGKALGGGLPLSAFCGSADVMEVFKPVGNVQHSGTFNAPLITILAGLAFINEFDKPEFHQHLERLARRLATGFKGIAEQQQVRMITPMHGARFGIILGRDTAAQRYEDTFCHDHSAMLAIIRKCAERGVYFHDYGGAAVHHGFSVQHTTEDIDIVLDVFSDSVSDVGMA